MPIGHTISRNGSHSGSQSFDGKSFLDGSEYNEPSRRFSQAPESSKGLPGWVPWALGGIAVGAICYGLLQMDSVKNFLSDLTEPITDFISGDEFEDNQFVPRSFEDESDFGSGDFGSSASERLRSQL